MSRVLQESTYLSLWLTGNVNHGNWKAAAQPVDFYYIKSIVESILKISNCSEWKAVTEVPDYLSYGQTISFKGQPVVHFGEVSNKTLSKFDMEEAVYYIEFDWEKLLKLTKKTTILFQPIPKYPSIRRDLALLVDRNVEYASIESIANKYGKRLLRAVDLFDDYRDKNMDASKKSYAISFIFRDDDKTLNDKQVDKIMKQLIQVYQKELGGSN